MPPKNISRISKVFSKPKSSAKFIGNRSKRAVRLATVSKPETLIVDMFVMAKPAAASASTSKSSPPDLEYEPVYFWKPNQKNGFLGQWYESEFTVERCTYETAEMWMMVQKARLFGDEDVAKQMLETTDPKRHRALGRQVESFDEKVWNENKLRIVIEGNYHKFTISNNAAALRAMLLATEDRELVEASPMDRIWGIGFGEKNAGANRKRWGQNLLGKAVMEVRKKLREEAEKKEQE